MILPLIDSGLRRVQLAGMGAADVNSDLDVIRVLEKGGRERARSFGRKAGQTLNRYPRARSRHRFADSESLWTGLCGPITRSGSEASLKSTAASPRSKVLVPTSSGRPLPTSGSVAGAPAGNPHQVRSRYRRARSSTAGRPLVTGYGGSRPRTRNPNDP
jgi:integrase